MKEIIEKLINRNVSLNKSNEDFIDFKRKNKKCIISNRISDMALKENTEQIKFNNDLLKTLMQEL